LRLPLPDHRVLPLQLRRGQHQQPGGRLTTVQNENREVHLMKILTGLVLLPLVVLLALPPAAAARSDGGTDFCSVSCMIGGSCSAAGPPPCECRCAGFLGLKGPRCSCGGAIIDNPTGD
jgi:hypothetical protein